MDFPSLNKEPLICVDLETTGLSWWRDSIMGVAVAVPDQSWYFPTKTKTATAKTMAWLKRVLPTVGTLVNHNIKFDLHFLMGHGVRVDPNRVACTMVAAALLNEHERSYSLDHLCKKYMNIGKDYTIYEELAEKFGGKATAHDQGKNLAKADTDSLARYARTDVEITLKLWQEQSLLLADQDLMRVWRVEMDLLHELMVMERIGVRVDIDQSEKAATKIGKEIDRLQRSLDREAGMPINPNPSGSIHQLFTPKQTKDGRWKCRDGTIVGSTGAGKASLDADALRRMTDPCAPMILDLRKMKRVKEVMIEGHILNHHIDGVIHANYNQTKSENNRGTGTGRLSVNDPALQQIHKRDKILAQIVRSLFIPHRSGQLWHCFDWEQMDFRCAAHYIRDPAIFACYSADVRTDFHQLVADITGLPRSPRFAGDPNAKQINLGLLFGMGQGKLAMEMGLPYSTKLTKFNGEEVEREMLVAGPEAEEIFSRYHAGFPRFRSMLKRARARAKARGFVVTYLGRRIRFPHGKFTHKAGGLIFQGTAADCLKIKIVELGQYLRSVDEQLVLNVHDEFDCNITRGRKDVIKESKHIIEDFDLRVPILSDSGTGKNWHEASK